MMEPNGRGARDPDTVGELRLLNAMEQAARRVRLHMPGHFGHRPPGGRLAWRLDLTEVEGLDTLSAPSGVLRDLIGRVKNAYGAVVAWISVQGATLPVLAGTLGLWPAGATVAVERHAHRSVLAAATWGEWELRWVESEIHPEWGLPLPTSPERWAEAIVPPLDGIVLVHPTYEGLAHPLAQTVRRARAVGARVFVDAAHGSHWGRSPSVPPHPLEAAPTLVAHGLHKTEPVLTQTGLLLGGPDVPRERIDEAWRMLATSSPSYLLLASVEAYIASRERDDGGWGRFAETIEAAWDLGRRRGFRILQEEWRRQGGVADPAKLTVRGNGPDMVARLRGAGMEPEAWGPGWVTLVVGPTQGFSRRFWHRFWNVLGQPTEPPVTWRSVAWPGRGPTRLSPALVRRLPWVRVPLRRAAGRIAARALTPYPPGIPAVMPGEEITEAWQENLVGLAAAGVTIEGVEEGSVWVIA
jgi:arginine decarboxylase